MNKLIAIGEALIDFIPNQSNKGIKNVEAFSPNVGGAPANVCGAYTRLGGQSAMITQLGKDPFGDKIIEEFKTYGIECSFISRTSKANTSLAFVALRENGDREFSFHRNPGADMLLEAEQIKPEWFEESFALHFCSVSLGDFSMKLAHYKAIEYADRAGSIVSFDPNIRLMLWEEPEKLKEAILEFLPKADVIKISDEEIEFITGKHTVEEAEDRLFVGNVKVVLLTLGSGGAIAYTKKAKGKSEGFLVEAIDTTGAGDAFIGSFLYQLARDGVTKNILEDLTEENLKKYLTFSNRYCSLSVMKKGAIASYPTEQEMNI